MNRPTPSGSAAFRRLNPALFPAGTVAIIPGPAAGKTVAIRQQKGPAMNKTEADFFIWIGRQLTCSVVEREPITLRLANGVRYTPDFVAYGPEETPVRAYEVKGRHAWDDAIVKLKVAAARFPWLHFWLAVRADGGAWKMERVLP